MNTHCAARKECTIDTARRSPTSQGQRNVWHREGGISRQRNTENCGATIMAMKRDRLRILCAAVIASALLTVAGSSLAAELSADEVRTLLGAHQGTAPPDLSNKDLSGLDLSHVDFRGANL